MNSLTAFGWLAAALQLTVPSYALRLNRLFGTRRVGWYLVTALVALALMRLVEPFKVPDLGLGVGGTLNAVFSVCSVLLLVGMGHLEAVFTERTRAERREKELRREFEAQLEASTAELVRANEQLRARNEVRERIENALRASEHQYRALFMDNPHPMWIFEPRSRRMLAANHAALRVYGLTATEFLALAPGNIIAPDQVAAFFETHARPNSGTQSQGLWRHFRKDRTLMEVEVKAVDVTYGGSPARLVLVNEVTRRRQRELEFRQTQKMEAVGQLAGGIAHHFNNIFAVLVGHASLLLEHTHKGPMAASLDHINTATARGADLTRQLLAFAGRHPMQSELLNLNSLLGKLTSTLRAAAGDASALRICVDRNLPEILADPRMLETVVLNLVSNARDAMPGGGALTISTQAVSIDEFRAQRSPDSWPGDFVCLTVRDSGCGMSQETQAHLFEPFFTTKEVGKADGLGLAAVYGMVRQHSGWIETSSRPGVGTEFRVFLPRAARPPTTADVTL